MNETLGSLTDNKNKIAELIETFSVALTKKGCVPEVLDILHRISFLSEQFFIHSGFFNEKYNIKSFIEHEKKHDEFVKKLQHFQKRLENGENMLSFDLFDYIKDWFVNELLPLEKEILALSKTEG